MMAEVRQGFHVGGCGDSELVEMSDRHLMQSDTSTNNPHHMTHPTFGACRSPRPLFHRPRCGLRFLESNVTLLIIRWATLGLKDARGFWVP